MYAHKKESAPTFGVKLLVSLALLAISLCLVGCVSLPAPVEIEEKPISLTKADAADKITAAVSPLVADRTFSQVFPAFTLASVIPLSTSTDKLAALQVGTGTPTEYEILLPKDKTITDYVNAIKKDLGTVAKDEASIKAALEGKFKQSAFALGIKFDGTSPVQADFSLPELEQLIYKKFNWNSSAKQIQISSSSSSSTLPGADKGIFTSVFTNNGPIFDVDVYLPQSATGSAHTPATFVKECVKNVNDASGSASFSNIGEAAARLLEEITNNLKDKGDSNVTLCKWSDILAEMIGWWFETTNVISKTGTGTQFTKGHFKITGSISNIPGKYAKFYVDFGTFNMKTGVTKEDVLVEYLKNFTSTLSPAPTSFKLAVPLLIKATLGNTDVSKRPCDTNAPTGVDSNHTMVQGDIAALMTEIDKAIGPFKFPKFTAADFTPYPTDGCLFADGATANDLCCATFPSVKGTTPAFESYAKFVAELKSGTASVIDYTKSYTEIKNAYFDELWKPANLAAYKATFGTPAPPGPADPPKPDPKVDVDATKVIDPNVTSVVDPNATNVIDPNATNVVDPNAANVDAEATSNSNSSTTESDSSKVGTEKQNDNGTTADNNSTQKKSGDSWWILWTILAIAVVLGLLGGGYLYYSHTQSRKESL